MKQFIFLTTTFLVLFTSCKKDNAITYNIPCNTPTTDATISSSLIIGKWKWVSEYYCGRGVPCVLKTPASVGYTRDWAFDKSNTATAYKNGVFVQNYFYNFDLEKVYTLYHLDTETVLAFKDYQTGGLSNYVHFQICNDTLVLNYQIRSDGTGQRKWAKY
jgi:hypothetical protein